MKKILPILICLMAMKVFAAIPTFGSFDATTLRRRPTHQFHKCETNWVQGIINATPNVANAVTNISGLVATNETRTVVTALATLGVALIIPCTQFVFTLIRLPGRLTSKGGGIKRTECRNGRKHFHSHQTNQNWKNLFHCQKCFCDPTYKWARKDYWWNKQTKVEVGIGGTTCSVVGLAL